MNATSMQERPSAASETTTTDFGWSVMTGRGLQIVSLAAITWESLEHVYSVAASMHESAQWSLGDAYNAGSIRFGERVSQLLSPRGPSLKTIRNAASVCKAFPYSHRVYDLSFSHYSAVARLANDDPERARDLLQRAQDEDLPCSWLEEQVAEPPDDVWTEPQPSYGTRLATIRSEIDSIQAELSAENFPPEVIRPLVTAARLVGESVAALTAEAELDEQD